MLLTSQPIAAETAQGGRAHGHLGPPRLPRLARPRRGRAANPEGWLRTSYLRLHKADPITTTVYDAQIGTPGAAAHLGPLPIRRGPRPTIAPWPIPHRQLDQFPGPEIRAALDWVFDDALPHAHRHSALQAQPLRETQPGGHAPRPRRRSPRGVA
jgi:hypothetical protein